MRRLTSLIFIFLIPTVSTCPELCTCTGTRVECIDKGLTSIPSNLPIRTTELVLSFNEIDSIHKNDLIGTPNLESLVVNNNTINYIEPDFMDVVVGLKRLDLSCNILRRVPRLSSFNNSLVNFNISWNLVSKFHKESISRSPGLRYFSIFRNRIQTLPTGFFIREHDFKFVNTARNPWNCDCRLLYANIGQAIGAPGRLSSCIFPPSRYGLLIHLRTNTCYEPVVEEKDGEYHYTCPIVDDGKYILNTVWVYEKDELVLKDGERILNGTLITPNKKEGIECAFDRLKAMGTPVKLPWIRRPTTTTVMPTTETTTTMMVTMAATTEEMPTQMPSEMNPQLIFKQQDTTSRDGETLELKCEAVGTPMPIISWYFNNEIVVESRKHKLLNNGNRLKVYPFLNTDAGQYKCVATNSKGTDSHIVKVTLLESMKPMIVDVPMNTKATIGQQVTLRCRAQGEPVPEIAWLFEGTRIPRRNTRFTISDDNTELVIEKVTRHDSGVFTCHAINSIGSAVAVAELMVGMELTKQVDKIIDEKTIDSIAMQAKEKVESALAHTKEQRTQDKIDSPHDLRKLFKFAVPLKKVDLGKAREIYEESIRLIQMHIESGLKFDSSTISPNVSYEAVLPVSYVQTLMEKSGCQTGQFVESCEDHCFFSKYRSYDGQCNNYEHPMWGVSEMSFLRLLPPRYENGFNTPVGWEKGKLYNGFELPNARKVSRFLVGTDDITPHDHLTAMTMQWGQFIDHDLTLTAPALTRHSYREGAFCNRTCENADPCFNIQLEADDPKLHTGLYLKHPCMEFERNGAACGSGETSPIFQRVTYRDQLNVLTSYLDASGIYGNSEEQALELRDLYSDHGLLRFDIVSSANKPYMPFEKDSDMDCRRNYSRENPINCFLSGDIRANEQLGLMSMHTIFMREHNRIASKLLEVNANWDGETIFQETRKIVGAVLQHITYSEWLPKILGKATFNEIIGEYKGYNPDINPTIANEFATAALRFAHTLINPKLFRFDKDFKEVKEGHILLHNAFFAPERMVSEGGVDPLLRGLFAAPIKLPRPDQLLNKELTEKLFNRYHEVALDLAALNIQRGRDHGLPPWTEYRRFCNLTVPKTWDDLMPIVQDAEVINKLRQLYGVPENIDLWVGGVTEKRTSEALMGPTLACIIADQFRRLRDGDRFWYENDEMFTKSQIRQIKKVTLSKIVCDNGDDIDRVQPDIFIYHGNNTQFFEQCDNLPSLNLRVWTTCCDAMCQSAGTRNNLGVEKAKSVKRMRRSDKKTCVHDGVHYPNHSRIPDREDKCTECNCRDGKVYCRFIDGCTYN